MVCMNRTLAQLIDIFTISSNYFEYSTPRPYNDRYITALIVVHSMTAVQKHLYLGVGASSVSGLLNSLRRVPLSLERASTYSIKYGTPAYGLSVGHPLLWCKQVSGS